MNTQKLNILLAEDDKADCLLFQQALGELPISASLSIVNNGEQLIETITNKENTFPDVLFLDLNMPRKNGFVSLGEIKRDFDLQRLPVIVFSTSSDANSIKSVFRDAAHYYISKPSDFHQLKKVIYEALVLITQKHNPLPLLEKFILTGDTISLDDKS